MVKFIALLAAVASLEAGAVDLSSGESLNINGTVVTCQASQNKCSIERCVSDLVAVSINEKRIDNVCHPLSKALEIVKSLKEAGLCN